MASAAAAQEGKTNPAKRKYFIPLENNPEVMTSLVHNLGLSPGLAFHDVYSIDDQDLLAFVPRPAHALLLVFPTNATYERFRDEEESHVQEYTGKGPQEPVMWYKQTIGNACGLIGVLHGVSNGAAREHIAPNSNLAHLLDAAEKLPPHDRANLLYESAALESAHMAAAVQGDTAAPGTEAFRDFHYVCFVKARDGHLWELDGARKGPLDHGLLPTGEDVLSSTALKLGPRKYMEREATAGSGEMRFSLIVLAPSLE